VTKWVGGLGFEPPYGSQCSDHGVNKEVRSRDGKIIESYFWFLKCMCELSLVICYLNMTVSYSKL
jgi:hypothetical protein